METGSPDPRALRQAIAALESQRATLGDATTELALAPLRRLLEQAEATPALRRAQVTVLFADIVESTALASRLDAEDVLQVFGRMLERAAACVRARGGRVLRYTGDGLKAGFGAQGTREDDAARAVLAGLDILAAGREHAEWVARRHGEAGFALRVGAHTGEVALGAGFEADNTLSGETVNVAARMEQSAPPGALRISAETWAHVRGRFEAEAQPPLVLKGVEQPMATWLVRAARGGGAERGIEGLAVPMIGRDAERAALAATIRESTASGTLRAVTVVADAGLGKTRLLREVLAEVPQALTRVVRAHPGAELRPWGLLHGLLSAHCGIGDGDTAERARDKLLAGLAPALADDAQAKAQRIGQLLGMDFGEVPALRGLDARALRDLAFAALRDWLAGLCSGASDAPVVLVFEDLQWADEASLDALAHWWDHAQQLPLTLLMSTRPPLLERRPDWCQTGPACRRLALTPLPPDASGTLAAALLQRVDDVPGALRTLLVERADGNPFYMEELLRRLLDDGALRRDGTRWHVDARRLESVRLPTTLVGLLQARLDALPPAECRAAQLASVVGHVFWDDALAQLDLQAPTQLEALQRRQWVRLHATSAFEGTAERRFDHHLLHQVTYGTVLKEERRRGHAAVARWLAERTAGRAPEFMAITGDHAERAGDLALACRCYVRASEEAGNRYANALSIECTVKALRLLPAEDLALRRRLLQSLNFTYDLIGDREGQERVMQERRKLLASHPDPVEEAEQAMYEAMLHDRLGELDPAWDCAQRALSLAIAAGADDTASFASSELCWLEHMRGHPEQAQARLEAAREFAVRVRVTNPLREIQVLQLAGILAGQAGRAREAITMLEEASARGDAAGEWRAQLASVDLITAQLTALADHAQALQMAERLLGQAQAIGDPRYVAGAHGRRAEILCQAGRPREAAAEARHALELYRAIRDTRCLAQHHETLGLALSGMGDARASQQAFEDARLLWEGMLPGSPKVMAALALRCEQDLALGDFDAARTGIEQVLAAMGADGAGLAANQERDLEARAACGRVLLALGDPRAAALLARLHEDARALAARMADDGREPQALIDATLSLRRALEIQAPDGGALGPRGG